MRNKKWLGSLIGACLILNGCAAIRPPASSVPARPGVLFSEQQRPPLSERFHAQGRWELDGKSQGGKRASGYFDWQHAPEKDTLILLSSWSLPLAELQREGEAISITTSQGQRLTEEQWNEASRQILGVPLALPLQPLSAWIQGHFDPSRPGRIMSTLPSPSEARLTLVTAEQEEWGIQWLYDQGNETSSATKPLYPQRVEIRAPDIQYELLLIPNQESSSWK